MSDSTLPRFAELPEVVRSRIVALVARSLPTMDRVPAALRRVSTFAPTRRARLGGAAITAELTTREAFRSDIARLVADDLPEIARIVAEGGQTAGVDPVDLAALCWLRWEHGGAQLYPTDLETSGPAQAATDAASVRVSTLREQLAAADQRLRVERTRSKAAQEQLKAENTRLRQTLGEVRAQLRRERKEYEETVQALTSRLTQATGAAESVEAEGRRLRAQVNDLQEAMRRSRRDDRADRDDATIRTRLLLDTLTDAAQGLRRELAIPTVAGSPGDRVEEALTGDNVGGTSQPERSSRMLERLLLLPRARLIVDGYNVTKSSLGDSTLEVQRSRLLSALAALVSRTGVEATVVFDGAATQQRPLVTPPRGVKVIFSPFGVIADRVIGELVAAEPGGRVVIVVTSDREVIRDVVGNGARAVASEALAALLWG